MKAFLLATLPAFLIFPIAFVLGMAYRNPANSHVDKILQACIDYLYHLKNLG